MSSIWLSAEDALERLGTKPQTLYANVSRGRIRAKPDPVDSRRSLYHPDDVERLAGRSGGRRKAEQVAAETIRWGEPILTSGVSTVDAGRLFYRGEDAILLSETVTLEEVAALLWETPMIALPPAAVEGDGSAWERGLALMARRTADDAPSFGRHPDVLRTEAASVLASLASAYAGNTAGPLHERLAAGWKRPDAADAIRRALVLLADHELNASTFAVRVTVSTGASLAAGVLAGIAALSGPLHGAAATAVPALIETVERAGASAALRSWLGQGRRVPAFGHMLYPDGDPRATALLAHLPVPQAHAALCAEVETVVGERPNVDFALAALVAAYHLPPAAPLTLFALARTVGWLAHALEQITTGTLIRPRAHYVGKAPDLT